MVKFGFPALLLFVLCAQLASGHRCYYCGYASFEGGEAGTPCKSGDSLSESLRKDCTLDMLLPPISGDSLGVPGEVVNQPKSSQEYLSRIGQSHEVSLFSCIEFGIADDSPVTNTTLLIRTCLPYTSNVVNGCKNGGTLAEWGRKSDDLSKFVYSHFGAFFPGNSRVSGCSCKEDECNSQLNGEDLVGGGVGSEGNGNDDDASTVSASILVLIAGLLVVSYYKIC